MVYTTSSLFLKTLADCGVTHVFVNWGSDHPALLEDLQRQHVQSHQTLMEIITCPNEMVALSAAQGYAQVTGKPAAVIVHVDVGTLAMGGALHNVDRANTPVLIYAGASPFTDRGELKGSKNEWIMWAQDVPDQAAIVRQYMRFTSQIQSAKNVENVVRRGLQIATSEPKGPVYLWGRREVMEEEVDEAVYASANKTLGGWPSIEPAALSDSATKTIAAALIAAKSPLIITTRLGQNLPTNAPSHLLALSNKLAIPIMDVCPSVVNVPYSHPYYLGSTFLAPGSHTERLITADVILALDTDTPWMPSLSGKDVNARVFLINSANPLHTTTGYWHVPAEMICTADTGIALAQIVHSTDLNPDFLSVGKDIERRRGELIDEHAQRERALDGLEARISDSGTLTVANVLGTLRRAIKQSSSRALILNEGVSRYNDVPVHMRAEEYGGMLTSGGSSLGWALGASVGAFMGDAVQEGKKFDLIVAIVGDGSYLFGVPSSVYWMARRYNTPFLTVILNNGGWTMPKISMLALHQNGFAAKLPPGSNEQLTTGLGPYPPHHSQIAVAASAGWAHGQRVDGHESMETAFDDAIKIVREERRCVVLDCGVPAL